MASGAYVYPDCYLAGIFAKQKIAPEINPLKRPVHRIGEFHSEAAPREEENGRFPDPVLLTAVVRVLQLWHHHSRVVMGEKSEPWAIWANRTKGGTVDPQN